MLHKVCNSIAHSVSFQQKPGPLSMSEGIAGKADDEQTPEGHATCRQSAQFADPPALKLSCLRRQRLAAGCCAKCQRL